MPRLSGVPGNALLSGSAMQNSRNMIKRRVFRVIAGVLEHSVGTQTWRFSRNHLSTTRTLISPQFHYTSTLEHSAGEITALTS